MKLMRVVTLSVLAAGFSGLVRADWDVGDPFKMHAPQLPDLQQGVDVLASYPYTDPNTGNVFGKWVADDWQCTESGPVTDIHIWGSWLDDLQDQYTTFSLAILADDRTNPDFSKPGAVLWNAAFLPGSYTYRLYATANEYFFDPNIGDVIGSDTQAWQYNFYISDSPFVQEQGQIYWLAVQAIFTDTTKAFGWKSSDTTFFDRAVYGDSSAPGVPLNPPDLKPWEPIASQYPHDMAFVITTPEPQAYGFLAGLGLVSFAVVRRFLRK